MKNTNIRVRIGTALRLHFGQSKNCTWTSPPLDTTMDFEGTGDLAEAILTGTYDVSQLPTDAAKWVVQALQYVAGHQEVVDAFVTPEEMIGKLRTWSEKRKRNAESSRWGW